MRYALLSFLLIMMWCGSANAQAAGSEVRTVIEQHMLAKAGDITSFEQRAVNKKGQDQFGIDGQYQKWTWEMQKESAYGPLLILSPIKTQSKDGYIDIEELVKNSGRLTFTEIHGIWEMASEGGTIYRVEAPGKAPLLLVYTHSGGSGGSWDTLTLIYRQYSNEEAKRILSRLLSLE